MASPGFSKDHARALYDEGSCQVSYLYNEGLIALPVGGAGATQGTVLVRLSLPQSHRATVFRVVRMGAMPEIPSAQPLSENEVLLTSHVKAAWPLKTADGIPVYSVEGEYHFAHKQAIVPGVDLLPVGTGPYDPTAPASFSVKPEHFAPTSRKPARPSPRAPSLGQQIISNP